jgi:adenylosuccinate lyase
MSGGLINSEAVMMALAPSLGRQRAHEVVYESSMRAFEATTHLRESLLANETISAHLSEMEIDHLLEPESYLGLAQTFVDRVVGRVPTPSVLSS